MRRCSNMIIGALLGVGALAFVGCGDDDGADARVTDLDGGTDGGGVADAGGDIDAAPEVTFSGSISVQELSIYPLAQLGSGMNITAGFTPSTYKAPTIAGPIIGGCNAFEYSPADIAAEPGLDVGTIQLTHLPDGKNPTMVFPPCNFIPGSGYLCIGGSGTGATTVIPGAAGPGTAAVVVAGTTFTADEVGRYVRLGGLGAGNNGAFPIAGVNEGALIIVNPGAAAETATAGGTFTTIAGAGPIPGNRDWMGNSDGLTVALTPSAEGPFAAFTKTFAVGGGVGDSFTLDDASKATVLNLPDDGSEFSVGCDGAGGECGVATGSVLSILSSDGSIEGLAPFVMPPLVTKRVTVTCTKISGTDRTLTVEAPISALLSGSNPTRVRTTYIRPNLQSSASINIIAGHAVAAFSPFPTAE